MAELENTRCDIDGEEAKSRGRASIFKYSWNREEGEDWARKFFAQEARNKTKTTKKQIMDALRAELTKAACCATCGCKRDRSKEIPNDWHNCDQCPDCRANKIRIADREERYCRYCSGTFKRKDVLTEGKKMQSWVQRNKCDNCLDVMKRIEEEVLRLYLERMAGSR